MKSKVSLLVHHGVTPRVKRHVQRLFQWLQAESPLKRRVKINVVAKRFCYYFWNGERVDAWGVMKVLHKKKDPTLVYVAGCRRPRDVALVLAHEWVHCERERDGKSQTEAGINPRAQALYSRFLREEG